MTALAWIAAWLFAGFGLAWLVGRTVARRDAHEREDRVPIDQ